MGVGTLCGVESVDVRLVMLFVVKLHNLAGDVRLKSVIWIREVWENVRHGVHGVRGGGWWKDEGGMSTEICNHDSGFQIIA